MSRVLPTAPGLGARWLGAWRSHLAAPDLQVLARLWRVGRLELTALLVLSAAISLLMLTPSLYMLQVYDRVVVSRSELTLLAVSLLALFLMGLCALLDWSRARLLGRCVARLEVALADTLLAASLSAALARSQGQAQGRGAGALKRSEPLQDWASLRRFLNGPAAMAFLDAPWAPVYVGVLFLLHPVLGGVALFFVVLQAALVWQGHQRLVTPQRAAVAASRQAHDFVSAKQRNAELIEALGMTAPLLALWQQRHTRALRAQGRAEAAKNWVLAASKWLRYSQQSLGLGTGALLVIQGELTPGAMIAAAFLITRALAPIDQLVSGWPALIEAASR